MVYFFKLRKYLVYIVFELIQKRNELSRAYYVKIVMTKIQNIIVNSFFFVYKY